jgi:hypothetical protein
MTELRLRGQWQPLDAGSIATVGCHMGVYEVSSPKGEVVFIGYAGGRSVFGLRGELIDKLAANHHRESWFRYEVTTSYLSRYKEVLMVHVADHGAVPAENDASEPLGRLSPT